MTYLPSGGGGSGTLDGVAHYTYEVSSGASSYSLAGSGLNDIPLNTERYNTISGMSRSGNTVVTPAGTYEMTFSAFNYYSTQPPRPTNVGLYDGSSWLYYQTQGYNGVCIQAKYATSVILAAQKSLLWRVCTSSGGTPGYPSGLGVECYVSWLIKKVA
jgi:hypothetical protein